MRRMDRDLIERGYTVRALVQWWGGYGQTVRPYLWKEKSADSGYKESWGELGRPAKTPERFAAGQYTGMDRNTRYQKIEGTRIVRAPVSPVRKDTARCWSLTGKTGGGCAPVNTAKNTPVLP